MTYLPSPQISGRQDRAHVLRFDMACLAVAACPLDFAGPFQGAMFLVGIDAYSKWPEVRLM